MKSIFPFLSLIVIILLAMVGCTHHYADKFPKRLEIVRNDGNILELNMNELAKDEKKYYVKISVKGKIHKYTNV